MARPEAEELFDELANTRAANLDMNDDLFAETLLPAEREVYNQQREEIEKEAQNIRNTGIDRGDFQ